MSYNHPPKGDLQRLPKWAQEYIRGLKLEISNQDRYIKELTSEYPGSNLVLNANIGRPDKTLPPDSTIRFHVGTDRESEDSFEVHHNRRTKTGIEVRSYSMGPMLISPRSGNSIYLEVGSR